MSEIAEAAKILADGGVVAFPTETVYGLGANVWDESAVRKIFEIKGRPETKPLLLHLASVEDVDTFVAYVPDKARELMTRFWPGPLTLVLPKNPAIPDQVTAGGETVGLRVPGHPIARDLAAELSKLCGRVCAVAAPSANKSGQPPPVTADDVRTGLRDRLGTFALLDRGACPGKVPSTVVGVGPDGQLTVFREGAISPQRLR